MSTKLHRYASKLMFDLLMLMGSQLSVATPCQRTTELKRFGGGRMRWWRYCLVLLALFTGTGTARGAVSARDDTGHTVLLSRPAKRVVSLAPSSTEMVFAVGAGALLVGVSTYDDFPPAARKLPKIGTFSGPDLERIVAARPDLVVAAYGNPLELIDRLRRRNIAVYVSNPSSVDGVLRNLSDL